MQRKTARPRAKPRPIDAFPLPPLTAQPAENAVVVGDAVTITPASGAGARVSGALLAFSADTARLAVIPDDGSERIDLDFASIKILTLTRVRRWAQEPLPVGASVASGPSATQPFEIGFRDGDALGGNTLGFRNDRSGVYLYPTQAERQYIAHFIPHEAID
ncbi:MAG: hypothetical protein ACKO4A_06290, partial [Gammaproteobacteria bacterium]